MARTPTADRPAISQWLIRAREAHGMTAAAFLAALRDEAGSAPNAATYALWESGRRTPKDMSLEPVLAFWHSRGVAGPTPTAPAPAVSLEERTVLAMERQAAAAERQAAAMELHVALLARQTIATEAIAGRESLPQGPSLSAAEDELLAYARSFLARTPSLSPLERPAP